MNGKRFLFKTIAVCAIASMVLFTACKKSNMDSNNDVPVAGLMAVNMVPSKTVAVTIGGNVLGSALTPNSYTGTYLRIFPGNRTIESFDYDANASLATASDSFEVNKFYSVFILGTTGAYQNVIVNDNFDNLTNAGQAYVRYINGINGSANAGVTISGSSANNSPATFGTVSDFVSVTPGSTTITVSDGSSLNINRTITTEANMVYTVLLSSGATSSDPAQIKYIVNGKLDVASGQRVSAASQTAIVK